MDGSGPGANEPRVLDLQSESRQSWGVFVGVDARVGWGKGIRMADLRGFKFVYRCCKLWRFFFLA